MLTRHQLQTINDTRRKALQSAESQRTSEVARIANDLQAQGVLRTEALKLADRRVPR